MLPRRLPEPVVPGAPGLPGQWPEIFPSSHGRAADAPFLSRDPPGLFGVRVCVGSVPRTNQG